MISIRHLVVACSSMSLIAMELVWTRIFSAEFFYTFAFLTLSLAIMGLGLGGLALRMSGFLNRERTIGVALSLAALACMVGPPMVFRMGLDFSQLHRSWGMVGIFLLALGLLAAPFFFGGIALSAFFKQTPSDIPRLYMADLLGAGIGVLGAIALMNGMGTPAAAFWISLPLVVAAGLVSRGLWRLLPVPLLAGLVLLPERGYDLLELEREEPWAVIYRHWDAMAKIKVYDRGPQARGINIDNVANTPLVRFDGQDWAGLQAFADGGGWDIDVGNLLRRVGRPTTFLSIGAGGGSDVLQALSHRVDEIHAVEVIPHINRMMVEGDERGYMVRDSTVLDSLGRLLTTPEFTGRIYHDPRVKVVTGDARTYVRRFRNHFDLIFSLSSNTWAALGSGSFALAENYLFTTEAFKDYWMALSDEGFLSMEHQVYVPRLVAGALLALEELGVERPREHLAVYNLPAMRRNILLLSKQPLTEEVRNRAYGALTPENQDRIHLLYPPADSLRGNLVNRIVVDGWEAHADSAGIDISPATDDRPFVAQLGRWRNLTHENFSRLNVYAEFAGFPLSKLTIVVILAVVLVVVVPLNLLPYLRAGPRLGWAPWMYFFLIGAGFMGVEVVLIQRYTLFLGASAYSTATVLFTLLLSAGIGSRISERVGNRVPFLAIPLWLLLEVGAFGPFTSALATLPLWTRILSTGALLFPLGLFMGMPFPMAVRRVRELVDWGFSVNGAGSVLGATAIVLLALSFGFRVSLLSAGVVYLVALGLFSRSEGWAGPGPSLVP